MYAIFGFYAGETTPRFITTFKDYEWAQAFLHEETHEYGLMGGYIEPSLSEAA